MKSHVVLTKVEYIHIHITASSYTSQHERTLPLHHRPLEQHCQTDAVSLTHSLLPPIGPLSRLPPAWFAYKHHKPVLQHGWPATPDPDSILATPHGSRDLSARRPGKWHTCLSEAALLAVRRPSMSFVPLPKVKKCQVLNIFQATIPTPRCSLFVEYLILHALFRTHVFLSFLSDFRFL